MSHEELINNHIAAFNAHDIDKFMDTMSDDVTGHWIEEDNHVSGSDNLRAIFANFFENDPTAKLGIRQILVEGDKAIVVEQFLDTKLEAYKNKRTITINHIRNGKISEFWMYDT